MSMNLYFETKAGGYVIDFPFQTNTNCTYAVLAAKSVEEQMKILREHYGDCIDNSTFIECEYMLRDSALKLIYL